MPSSLLRILPVALVLCLASPGQGAVITAWDTLGVSGVTTSVPPTFSATNVTGSSITRGAGLTAASVSNAFNSSGWTQQATDHVEFGFDVAAGHEVTLDVLKIATRSSGTGPGQLGLYTSLDGFTAAVFTFNQPNSLFVNSAIDLSSLGPIDGSFRVRIAQIGNTAANGGVTASGGTFRVGDFYNGSTFEDIQFEGTVHQQQLPAVPEPTSLLLWGAAGAAVLCRYLRHRVVSPAAS